MDTYLDAKQVFHIYKKIEITYFIPSKQHGLKLDINNKNNRKLKKSRN